MVKRNLIALVLLVVFASGCAQKQALTRGPIPRRVGEIALVNEPLGFVLVDVGSAYSPPVGLKLQTAREGSPSGVVTVTAERNRPFIAADITEGTPQKGDDVIEITPAQETPAL